MLGFSLIFLLLVTRGHSLKCFECASLNCDLPGIAQECSTAIVLRTHDSLNDLNPSLDSVAPVDADFACFLLNSSIGVDNGHSVPVVINGCTFRQTEFCKGWADDVMVHDCMVCHADECNVVSGNSPDPPGSSTTTISSNDTTTGVSTTTHVNPGVTGGVGRRTRIGTKLVIGGLSLMLIFFLVADGNI